MVIAMPRTSEIPPVNAPSLVVGLQRSRLKGSRVEEATLLFRFGVHGIRSPPPFLSLPENVREFESSQEKKPTPINFHYAMPFFCVEETERKPHVFQ